MFWKEEAGQSFHWEQKKVGDKKKKTRERKAEASRGNSPQVDWEDLSDKITF